MNPQDQRILALAKYHQRITELEAEINSCIDSITYWLNAYVHGTLLNIKEQDAKVLMDSLTGKMEEYRRVHKLLGELGG